MGISGEAENKRQGLLVFTSSTSQVFNAQRMRLVKSHVV